MCVYERVTGCASDKRRLYASDMINRILSTGSIFHCARRAFAFNVTIVTFVSLQKNIAYYERFAEPISGETAARCIFPLNIRWNPIDPVFVAYAKHGLAPSRGPSDAKLRRRSDNLRVRTSFINRTNLSRERQVNSPNGIVGTCFPDCKHPRSRRS